MKIHRMLTALFAALTILLIGSPVHAQNTWALPEKTEVSCETPAFYASIEYSFEGYIVKGTFTDFAQDTSLVQPRYSLDGKNYQDCGVNWNLQNLGTEEEGILAKLQNQTCLYSNNEPLKSYLAEELDSFYLKLRITRKNGITYETLPAFIDRGGPQPIPEGLIPGAGFSPAMSVIETRPFNYYGKYQLTIRENATAEQIASYLPDTLPVKIDLETGKNHFTDGIVNCPVKWKPLLLPQLTAGESVTIADAAEEIVVPEGTQVTTPTGIYQLDKPLSINQYVPSDKVRLILNVISDSEQPAGVLSEENTGLEMAFSLKPTGAKKLRAYTFTKGDSEWTEIPNSLLLKSVNVQPSTKGSGYTLVLSKTQEPYRSYLESKAAGDTPVPFFVGLKIEGGVYDGQQLILAWPDTYESPVKLPNIGGSGGNQNNAGTDNEGDSTENGQRPNLPHAPEDKSQPAPEPEDAKSDADSGSESHPNLLPNQVDMPDATFRPVNTENNTDSGSGNNRTVAVPFPNIVPIPTAKPGISINANIPDKASDAMAPDAGVPSNTEEKTGELESADRTTERGNHKLLVPLTVAAAAVLCIAGICFVTMSGKIPAKSRILRWILLRK